MKRGYGLMAIITYPVYPLVGAGAGPTANKILEARVGIIYSKKSTEEFYWGAHTRRAYEGKASTALCADTGT